MPPLHDVGARHRELGESAARMQGLYPPAAVHWSTLLANSVLGSLPERRFFSARKGWGKISKYSVKQIGCMEVGEMTAHAGTPVVLCGRRQRHGEVGTFEPVGGFPRGRAGMRNLAFGKLFSQRLPVDSKYFCGLRFITFHLVQDILDVLPFHLCEGAVES